MKVLVVCFANTCRSPVAEVLLQRALPRDEPVVVASKGLAGGVGETPEPMARALAAHDLALSSISGEGLTRDDARSADLLLFMERQLLRDAVVTDPSLWSRSFTFREFARRGFLNPPERSHESFAEWLAVLHAGRTREEMLGENEADDVPDPGLSGSEREFDDMITSLETEARKVAPLLSGWSTNVE